MTYVPFAHPLLLGLLGLSLAACAPKEVDQEPIRAVKTLRIEATGVGSPREFAAEIRARTESRLGFRVPGKLIGRSANNGDSVRAGQALARLDAADLKLGQDSALAGQRAAQTNLDQLESDLKRYKELRDQGFIGAAELERRDSAARAARAQWEQARAQAAAQGNQAAYAVLVAEAAGVITGIEAEPGQVVSAGQTVVRLAHDGPRDAVFNVPEDQVGAVRALLGRAGALSLQMWGGRETTPATVREVAGAADPVTRTFVVKADVGAVAVRLGQTATVRIAATSAAPGLRLPLTALFEQGGKSQVWVFERAAGAVRMQAVGVGGAEGNVALVVQGLKVGDEVVVAGTHVLTPGQKVRPYGESSAGPAMQAASR